MLMYYDARPSAYNGLFDFYTYAPLKGYYPFKMFNTLYELGDACKCLSDDGNIYAAAAKNEESKAVMISYFTDDDNCTAVRDIALDFVGIDDKFELFLLDSDNDAESVGTVLAGEHIKMSPNTVCLLKTI